MKITKKKIWLSASSRQREGVLLPINDAAKMAGLTPTALEKLSKEGNAPPIVVYQDKRYLHKEDVGVFIDQRSPKETLLLSASEAAKLIGVHRRTLETWSSQGNAPKPVSINGQWRYLKSEIVDWVNARCPSQKKGGK